MLVAKISDSVGEYTMAGHVASWRYDIEKRSVSPVIHTDGIMYKNKKGEFYVRADKLRSDVFGILSTQMEDQCR